MYYFNIEPLQRLDIATERIHCMHDNAHRHKAAVVEEHLDEMFVTKVRQTPYLRDVNRLDRYVLRNMGNSQRSHDFDDIPAVQQFVQDVLQNLTRMVLNRV